MINFIAWLIVGGMIGWLASIIMCTDTQQGILINIIVAIIGALLGGWMASKIFETGSINNTGLDLGLLLFSLLGAIIELVVVNWLHRGKVGLRNNKPTEKTSQLQSRTPSTQKHTKVESIPKPTTTINTTQERTVIENPPNPAPLNTEWNHAKQSQSIFISYRRDDTADISGRIYDRLVARFGKNDVFKDVDSIPFGVDFRAYLDETVGQCSILLVIIGRQWLVIENPNGHRRLDDPRDYVRIEIESALKRNIPVIPLLVQGASIPPEEMLPVALQSLSYRNSIAIRPDPDFHWDMDRLIQGIEVYLNEPR